MRRVLLLGHTGIQKAKVLDALAELAGQRGEELPRRIDFEREFLQRQSATWRGWTSFLAKDLPDQVAHWNGAWGELEGTLGESDDVFLNLHATYASQHYGSRSLLDIHRVCDAFHPTLVVTLIDDVFNAWRRTESLAQGDYNKGRPTLEELLFARRAESLIGEIIAARTKPPCRHVVFALGNANIALLNLLLHGAPVTYMSFPISAPRRLERDDEDFSFSAMLNDAHRDAYALMERDNSRCFVTPLAIDEKPFANRARDSRGKPFQFDCESDRWSLDALWGSADKSCRAWEPGAFVFNLRISKDDKDKDIAARATAAAAIIDTDVGWRDRKLVCQSRNLAVICPRNPKKDEITGGVAEELDIAHQNFIPFTVWQDARWDKDGYVARHFAKDEPGAMGVPSRNMRREIVNSMEQVLAANPGEG